MSTNDTGESTDSTDASDGGADVDEDGSTSSTASRWWLTNDLLAGFLIVSLFVLLAMSGFGWYNLDDVPTWARWAYLVLALAAGSWAFGMDLISAYKSGGGSS